MALRSVGTTPARDRRDDQARRSPTCCACRRCGPTQLVRGWRRSSATSWATTPSAARPSGVPTSASRMRCSHAGRRASSPTKPFPATTDRRATAGSSPPRWPPRGERGRSRRRISIIASTTSAARRQQCLRLLELASDLRGDPTTDLPLILGADLNAVPDSAEVRLLTGRESGHPGIVFSDTWEQAGDGPGGPGVATIRTPPTARGRIDVSTTCSCRGHAPSPSAIRVTARLVGTDAVVVDGAPVWPSDHAAVVAEFQTPG